MKPIFTITTKRKRIAVYPNNTRDMILFVLLCLFVMYILFVPCRDWTGRMIERAFTIL